MNRRPHRGNTLPRLSAVVAVVAAASGVWYFAGSATVMTLPAIPAGTSAASPANVKTTSSSDDAPKKAPEKLDWNFLFPDWPEQPKPALVIALTGEMNGYMRPCGCSEGQSGGLARRAGLLAFLRDTLKLNVLAVDLGDVVGKTTKLEEMRFDAARKALTKLGYKVVGLGRQDLTINLLTLVQKLANETEGVKTILGNIKAADKDMQQILEQTCKPIEVVEVGGKKIAVGSLMDPEFNKGNSDIKLDPLDAASEAMLKAAVAANAEVKVLLAYMTKEKAIDFAKAHQDWDVILTRSNGDDAAAQLDQHREGKTLIVQAGRKGKWTGIVGYWPEEKISKYRYAVVEVRPHFNEDASVEKIYNDFVKEIAQSDVLVTWSRLRHANGDQFVGAEVCGKCHTKAYKKWSEEIADSAHGKGHGHAFAFESLKKDKAKYQTSNPECVSCHTTGFEYVSGFINEKKTPQFLGNQCENCHGPGKRHADNKDDPAGRVQMKKAQTDIKNRCLDCHDADNSVHFNFDKYWPKIAHPWKD